MVTKTVTVRWIKYAVYFRYMAKAPILLLERIIAPLGNQKDVFQELY